MKTYSRVAAPDLTRQLVAAGVLTGGAQNTAITYPTPPGLLIAQDGGIVANAAFDLASGYGTGYRLSLHIAVNLPRLAIWEWKLDLPWEDPQFYWLPDPPGRVFPNNMYQIPGCPELFSRDDVINHRRVVRRGYALEGWLLGFGFGSIPDSYRHGANIDARLVLIDEMGRDFSTPIQLWVDRMAKIDRKATKKKARRPIFENQDWAEEELVQK